MTVAINVLGPSFDIKKSQGYLKWKEKTVNKYISIY